MTPRQFDYAVRRPKRSGDGTTEKNQSPFTARTSKASSTCNRSVLSA